jgi:chromosome segregation ATPase
MSSDDIIVRADAINADQPVIEKLRRRMLDLWPELVSTLKAERAQRDRDLEDLARHYVHLTTQLESALTEINQLNAEIDRLRVRGDY